jgi:GrpB-like predicted nucleotidyltransferase (UPF0157 family)
VRIVLAPYDERWPAQFEAHRKRLHDALGARALFIEHIGSTAVPGISAKPIVDVMIGVANVHEDAVNEALLGAGYDLVVDESDHRMYRPPQQDAHVHLWSDERDFQRHRAFRDRLREDAQDRALYEHIKRRLAERDWPSQNDYAQAKNGIVSAILRRANGQRRGPRVAAFADLIRQYVPAGSRVLEIGAGEGELAAQLRASGYDVVALDPQLRSTFPILEMRFEDYDAQPQSFDCIAAQLVLHHAGDLDAMLEKAESALRPGGSIAIDDYGWERSDDPAFRNDRSDLHTSAAMLGALRERFEEIYYADHAYFDEGAGTDALGFSFLGRRR